MSGKLGFISVLVVYLLTSSELLRAIGSARADAVYCEFRNLVDIQTIRPKVDIAKRRGRLDRAGYRAFLSGNSPGLEVHKSSLDDLFRALDPETRGINAIEAEIETINGTRFDMTLTNQIGDGGTKRFYLVGRTKAVAVPAKKSVGATENWQRIVQEELFRTRMVEHLGIPSLPIEPSRLRFTLGGDEYILPSYMGPTFDSYWNEDAVVLDVKKVSNIKFSTGFHLLPNGTDPLESKNWEGIVAH
jgi:hypothetical protein